MKNFKYKITTKLKEEIKDPKGAVIEDISKKLQIIENPSIKEGKYYEVTFECEDEKTAFEKINTLAKDVLTNPIIETYEIIKD